MKINEFLKEKILENLKKRLNKLVAIPAPEIIIEALKKEIKNIEAGKEIKISGDTKYLTHNFISDEIKIGQGGKKYTQFILENGEKVNYFPNAKYGRYIKKEKK